MAEKIRSGDSFELNGEIYECQGTDDKLIWYDNGLQMELVSADPSDCLLAERTKHINS